MLAHVLSNRWKRRSICVLKQKIISCREMAANWAGLGVGARSQLQCHSDGAVLDASHHPARGWPSAWIPACAGMTLWVRMVGWDQAPFFLGLDPRAAYHLCRAGNGPRVRPEGDAVGAARANPTGEILSHPQCHSRESGNLCFSMQGK